MSSIKLPIVRKSDSLGLVARRAAEHGVAAVLVRQDNGLSLVKVDDLPGIAEESIGTVAGNIGIDVPEKEAMVSRAATAGEARVTIDLGDLAEIEATHILIQTFDAPIGYKECTVNGGHIYPPSFPERDCPHQDGGKLTLKYF